MPIIQSTKANHRRGVDLHAPALQAAAKTCIPASHGAITRAKVQSATGATP
jgi:hypothetical protein